MTTRRLLGVWVLLAVAMSANGIGRELLLVPWLGRAAADALSPALGMAIILAVTWRFLHPLAGRADARPGRTALAWLGLTVAFECAVGRYVDGRSWEELLANYAIWDGRLWPLVLATLTLSPFLWTRWLVPGDAPPRASVAT